jgi:hypothetical protein
MTAKAMQAKRSTKPLDEAVDHVRGPRAGPLILEYGDYECPFSRRAFHEIECVEQDMGGRVRFAFRHFPLVEIHPHAFAAAAAAEAAAFQDRFWDMHELLFHRQKALEEAALASFRNTRPGEGPAPNRRASTRGESARPAAGRNAPTLLGRRALPGCEDPRASISADRNGA